MRQVLSALPVQCKKCGELFDLSYDLENVSQERLLQELVKIKINPSAHLCWECRNNTGKIRVAQVN